MQAKILIVEDEEKIARFLELELQHEGYEVQKAADGRTGLELAESGEFELMVLDVMLPQLNGLEVLRRLRLNSQLPVILLTARDAVMAVSYTHLTGRICSTSVSRKWDRLTGERGRSLFLRTSRLSSFLDSTSRLHTL